ncbi:uncharacterized protein Dana_GF22031, isoform C [Drosophila ananassae]|uniref:eIF-4F 25 kDa subunit n=2 Tax=Drosophila ananassae TaxID=7217 RepID=A0A0P8Y4X8_DROAN|nr:uncharacterized protein Dana_GF22031, isoform C [Drosophila ananassae]
MMYKLYMSVAMFPNNFYKMKNFANPKTMFKSCSSGSNNNNNNNKDDEVATESLKGKASGPSQSGPAGVAGATVAAAGVAPKEKAQKNGNAKKVAIPSTPSVTPATPDNQSNAKQGKNNKKNKLSKKLLKNQPPRSPSVSSNASVSSKDNKKPNNKDNNQQKTANNKTASVKDNNKNVPEKKVMMPEKKTQLPPPPPPLEIKTLPMPVPMPVPMPIPSQDISQEVAQELSKELPKMDSNQVAVPDEMIMPIEMAVEIEPPSDAVSELGDMVPLQQPAPIPMPINEPREPHHPLNSRWTLWYLENDRSKTWEDMLHEVTSFDTVENFWSLVNHIKPPSEIKMGSDYCLFKKGIRPMWEDEANVHGGRWVISLNKNTKSDLDNFWLDTMLCLIGESCEHSDELCGAVVNIRGKSNKISIWTADGGNEAAALEIGRKLREGLRMESAYVLQYQLHKDTMVKQGSTVKSIYTL